MCTCFAVAAVGGVVAVASCFAFICYLLLFVMCLSHGRFGNVVLICCLRVVARLLVVCRVCLLFITCLLLFL